MARRPRAGERERQLAALRAVLATDPGVHHLNTQALAHRLYVRGVRIQTATRITTDTRRTT